MCSTAIEALPRDEPLIVLADFDGTLAEFHPNPAAPMLTEIRREWLRDIAAQGLTFPRRDCQRPAGRRPAPAGAAAAARVLRRLARRGNRDRPPPLAASRSRDRARPRPGTDSAARRSAQSVPRRGARGQARVGGGSRAGGGLRLPHRGTGAGRCVRPSPGWPTRARAGSVDWEGKLVVEYLANTACHKGDAVEWIANDVAAKTGQQGWVVFLGDDETDEDAIRAIDRGLGILVRSRPTFATHQLDGGSEFSRYPSEVAHRPEMRPA